MNDNQLTRTGHPRELTQSAFLALLEERFGSDPMTWAFECPACGDVATGQDFRTALAENPRKGRDGQLITASALLGQECIGRTLGALSQEGAKWSGRGCNWCAYGLFKGPVEVTCEGGTAYCFPIASVEV